MKIKAVKPNNHRKAFEIAAGAKRYWFPYAQLTVRPSPRDPIKTVFVDKELGDEGFTYELASGRQDTVHLDHVLDYNRDPRYLQDLLLHKLTLAAQQRVEASPLSKRELIRRLGTSAAQFYRLLDQTNYTKSLNQMMALLGILDCDVDLVIKGRQGRIGKNSNRRRRMSSRLVEAT